MTNLTYSQTLSVYTAFAKVVQEKSRDIVARFVRFPYKDAVFQERRNLAEINVRIYVNEYLCKNTLEVKKSQNENLKEAKARG